MSNLQMVSGVKIRWLTTVCFEIVLPSGKVIITDPFVDESPTSTNKACEVTGADYMLVTHIHFDHMTEVGMLAKKFNSKIFVGDLSATELCKLHDLSPAAHIYRMRNGEKFEFEDCSIEAFSTRHIEVPPGVRLGPNYNLAEYTKDANRPSEEEMSFWYGFLESLSYLITTADGTTILVWGGSATIDQCNRLRGLKPNIAFIQATGSSAEDVSKLAGAIGAQIAIPHHHDVLYYFAEKGIPLPGGTDVQALLKKIKECMTINAPNTTFLELELGKWYNFGTAFEKLN